MDGDLLSILESFAEQTKFQAVMANGPGYIKKDNWKKLRELYLKLKGDEDGLGNNHSNYNRSCDNG